MMNKNNKPIPLFEIFSNKSDLEAVARVIKSKKNWAVGDEVKKFEEAIVEYVDIDYALTFNSGTSAIYASLLALGIGPGDEVIVPAFTYIATVSPISLVGAKPIFADIDKETLGLDPKDVVKKITSRTKAIIAVHYAGIPCQISELAKIAEKYKILLIEDAAEAFGSAIKNKKVGTFGDIGILSFSQGKIITTGEGGAIVTKSKQIYDELKLIRSLGRKDESDTTHDDSPLDFIQPGHNLRLSNILAALGVSQISSIEKIMKKRFSLANYYKKGLREIKTVQLINCPFANTCGYQLFTILAEDRDDLKGYLEKNEISSKVYFSPVYNHYLYRDYSIHLAVTEEVSSKVLSLPFYAAMKKSDVDRVIRAIKKYYSAG